jgi:hypothetical protein
MYLPQAFGFAVKIRIADRSLKLDLDSGANFANLNALYLRLLFLKNTFGGVMDLLDLLPFVAVRRTGVSQTIRE